MYTPTQFQEKNIDVMHQLIDKNPLATLVTLSSQGINANHIPLQLISKSSGWGTLHGHIARSNPIWTDYEKNTDALAIFQGPNAYISPSWYPSKKENPKVVPTWNYVVVHAYGRIRIIDDASWLYSHLDQFSQQHETIFPEPWKISDAPAEFTSKLIENLLGIEINISRLIGKWKVSQNQSAQNRHGVVEGLRRLDSSAAKEMAAIVNSRMG